MQLKLYTKEKRMIILLVLLLSAVGMTRTYAQSFSVGDLNYSVNSDGISVTVTGHVDGQNAAGALVIPDEVVYEGNSYTVTRIRGYAFLLCSGLSGGLTIPNSVTSIGESAFMGCIGFSGDLIIGNSVTSIGSSAFCNCSGFTGSLVIPGTVTTIQGDAFNGCSGFTGSLIIPNSVTVIEKNAFRSCVGFTEIHYNATNCADVNYSYPASSPFDNCGGYLIIGDNVERIPKNMFTHGSFVGELMIPNSVTTIGREAFSGCSGFTGGLVIPNSVTEIDDFAFSGCSGFTSSLTIPNSMITIGQQAFYNCTGFTSVYYTGNISQWCNISFGDLYSNPLYYAHNLYINNELLVELSIPETVAIIKPYAFCRATCINTLTIPNSVIEIGAEAFNGCSGITGNLIIPNSVTAIGSAAFSNCSGFTGDLTIPNSITTISASTFYNCSGFTGILTIPSSIIKIDLYAFMNCGFEVVQYNATNCADFSDSYGYPFSGCGGSLIIGDNVERIPAKMFYNAAFSGILTIGNSVTTIGFGAFYHCNGLTGVNYTGSIAQWCDIDFSEASANPLCCAHNLFINNELINNIVIPETVTMIKPYSFSGATCLTSLTISNSVTSIGTSAFSGCTGFTGNLTIGNSVTTIGDYAFYSCSGFTYMKSLAETPPSIGTNAFYSLNYNMPVAVPQGTINAYQNASGWNQFTNIHEICIYEIAVTANPIEGGTMSGSGTFEEGEICTLIATPNEGYSFCSWTENDSVVSYRSTYSFNVTGDRNLVANFGDCPEVVIGDGGTSTNTYLPSYSYYKYSLTQQIYTADEIGRNGLITSIAFYNGGATKTRDYDIFLVNTTKTSFLSATDWIAVTANDLVYSGSVTVEAENWTTIVFDTPFIYDGISNLALIVDDNTGSYTGSPHMACRVFDANGNQAIRIYSDNTNYDPNNPTRNNGTLLTVKNQIILNVESIIPHVISAYADPDEGGTTTGGGVYDTGQTCTLIANPNEGYYFSYWLENDEIVSFYPTYTFMVTEERNLVAHFCQGVDCAIPFVDGTVKSLCVSNWDSNNDGELSYAEAAVVTDLSDVFYNNSSISSFDELQYFTGLVSIGENEFFGCTNLISITIPNSVVAIGNTAFYNCKHLISIEIPASVSSIGNSLFCFCERLQQIIVNTGNMVYDSRENCNAIIKTSTNELISGCKNTIIPNTVTAIGNTAFRSCTGLTSIDIPNSVISIGEDAFESCYYLASIDIPNSVTSIGASAFSNLWYLTSVVIPNSVTSIEGNPFTFGSALEQIIVDSGNVVYDSRENCNAIIHTSTNSLISGCKNTTIPNSVTSIGNSAFYCCSSLTSIEFPNSVTSIGGAAFMYCSSLTSIVIPNSVVTVGTRAFFQCSNLISAVISDSVESINTQTFESCSNLNSVTIGNSVSSIGTRAFYGCTSLNTMVVGAETPPSLLSNAFFNVPLSVSITVPCGSIGLYQNALGWNQFANIQQSDCPSYEISVTSVPTDGGSVTGGGTFEIGEICTLIATPNEGYNLCYWTENDSVVSYSPTYSFIVAGDRFLVANFGDCPRIVIGDGGTSTNTYLPSYSFFKHSLTQQIYTTDEIGRNGLITSIAFYNGGATKTRDYEIYMVNTDKTSFVNATDWIAATADDLVYSGSVTMEAGSWTTIVFDEPFPYDGISNLALIVDDNSGNWTNSPHMACRVFDANVNQAIRIYSDNTNYNPNNPTQYNGTLLTVKNQIILGFSNAIVTNLSDEICHGNNYLQNGFEIYYPEVGENQYSITLPSSQNTDSIVNLTLTVHPTYFFTEDTTLCNATSFQWHGNTYIASGIYYDSLQTVHGCDSIFQLSLELFNTPLGEFASMTPTNNYPFTSLPISFTWDAVPGAEYYNLYLWNANETAPDVPFASHIYNRSYVATSLQNHQTYNWYVEAVNTCFSSTSSVRSFSLNIPPSMNVSTNSLAFGEVVLNDSVSMNMFVSGNALDDAITLQITGEDASMFSFEQGSNWNGLTGGSLTVTFSPTAVQYNYTANLVITTGTLTQMVQLSGNLADMFVFNTYVTQDVFEMNSTVPIYGTVTDVNNNPMASAEVEVKVKVMNTARSLFATTGADGHFSVDFVPAYSESGYYTINSGRVGHNSTAVHDDFNIPGMNLVTNGWILWDVVQNETSTGSIVIRNRSQIPLNNIQVTANNLPEGCSFSFQPLSLAGMEEGVLEYSVSGSTPTNGYQEVALVATSSEGASMNFTVWYRCAEPRGILYAAPNNITTTMTKGINKIVDVMLYNNGTGPTGSVYLDIPSVDWLSVVGNDTLPSIAVQDSAYFSLRLSANENTPLVQYTGNIAINCERGDGLLLPYTIMAVSDSTGTLVVDVTDDYTYNGNGLHLQGATVTVKGYYSLETVAIGLTDSNGLFTVSDIPEGYYRMSITAPNHAEYQATIQIEGGQTNTQNIYLQYQAITYSWIVVPTEIQDEYTFELIVEYETNVPAPVVVIDMPQTFPELVEGESFVFDYIISNLGLVDTYEATLYPPTNHPLYDFTPLITEIDTLHAQSSVVIPCTMTVRTGQRSPLVYAALNGRGERDNDCPDMAETEVWSYYYCNGEKVYVKGYKYVQIGSHPCNTPPSSSGGGGSGPGGHSSGGGGGGHHSGSGSSSTPPVTTQQQGCSEDPNLPGALEGAMGGMDGCPPPTDGTPKLPPQPGNNRRNNN